MNLLVRSMEMFMASSLWSVCLIFRNSSMSGCSHDKATISAARLPWTPMTLPVALNRVRKDTAPDEVRALLLTLESFGRSREILTPQPPP